MFVDRLCSSCHWKHELPPPYTLTLKSNSYIIFIAALSPTQLIITLKHSLGAHNDSEKSHMVVAEKWLEKHLKEKGKTKKELVKTLWDDNLITIAEVCSLLFLFIFKNQGSMFTVMR